MVGQKEGVLKIQMTAVDFLSSRDPKVKPLTPFQKFMQYGLFAKQVYCEKNKCWSIERKVFGVLENGIFTPDPGQSVKYQIRVFNHETNKHGKK